MRIVLITGTAAEGDRREFEFCDGEETFVADLKKTRNTKTQIIEGLRWSEIKAKDRYNKSNTYAFTIAHLHTSLAHAERYVEDHADSLPTPAEGEFRIYFSTTSYRYMTQAVIQSVTSWYFGKTSFHQYSVVGGIMRMVSS